jgi:hypothetical protein
MWYSLIILLGLVNIFKLYISLFFYFINWFITIIPKLYKCKIMIISMLSFRFWIFKLSYLLSFLVLSILVQPGSCPLCIPHPYPYLQAKTDQELCGEKERRMNTGIWVKDGGPCYSSWMFWSRITFPCHSVCPPTPSFHDHGRYFGQWNLSRGDISLPNESFIFCPTSWNTDIMTGDGAAMLDFFLFLWQSPACHSPQSEK